MDQVRHRLPAAERKKQILKCAVTCFAASNYRATTIKHIAAAAGISEAAIYKHFPSKKAIFVEILTHIHVQVLALWQAEADAAPDALTALENMGRAYFARMQAHEGELKVQFQAISEASDPGIAHRLARDHRDYVAFIDGLLKRGIAEGTIAPDADTHSIALMFDSLGVFANLMNLLGQTDFDAARSERILTILTAPLRK